MRCRKLLPESKMHKLIRYHEITPGAEEQALAGTPEVTNVTNATSAGNTTGY